MEKAEGSFVNGSRTARITYERASEPKGGRAEDNHDSLVITVSVLVCLLRLSRRVNNLIWNTVLALICHNDSIERDC